MNMIEKVALSIGGLENDRCNPCTPEKILKCNECKIAAKAAIAAMREPTDEMIEVANKCRFDVTVISNYKLIIDAALKE